MKPEQRKRMIVVGTFVLLGLLTLLAGVLIMGKQRQTFERTVAISAVFPDVNGLLEGNNVWMSGVKVGNVKKVKLYRDAQVEVVMNIEKKSLRFVRKDAKAKIGSDGLIGNRIVVLYGGSPDVPPAGPGDVLHVEKALSTGDVLHTLQENNKNLAAITGHFILVSKRLADGEGTIGKLLTDESVMNDLRTAMTSLKAASLNVQSLTGHLAGYSSQLQVKGTLANDLVTDTSVFHGLRTAVAQIKEVSKAANDVMGKLKNVSQELDSSNGLLGVLIRDKEVAVNVKSTIRNLQSGTEKLDENLEALQHSFLFRRYFKRKAAGEAKKINTAGKMTSTPWSQMMADSLNRLTGLRSDSTGKNDGR